VGSQTQWAVATPHALATEAGADAFARGGNAVDAALAAAASLTVLLPDNCGLGGDLIALVRDPSGQTSVVNASGPAAVRTSADDLRRRHGEKMPLYGAETVTVPGLLAGWEALWERGARLPWADAFGAAIVQAREGVPTARSVAHALADQRARLSADAGMRELFYPNGQPLAAGAALRQVPLAETLEQIAATGARAFYAGRLGASWLATLAAPLTADDLAAFEPEITAPLRASWGSQEVLTAPPNSQGALLLMILRALEDDPLLDPLSAEAPRLAAAFDDAVVARESFLADPRFSEAPSELVALAAGAGPSVLPNVAVASPRPAPRGDTVAVVAADGEGRAVSLIQSLYYAFGAGILDPATGISAHNRGAFFSLDPSSPNVIAPGKRPAHTLTPVIVEESGSVHAVLGTMGGSAQPQIVMHLLLHLRRGLPCDRAVAAPRWLLKPDERGLVVAAETGVPTDAIRALRTAGRPVQTIAPAQSEAGQAQLIARGADRSYQAASDPRSEGAARVRRQH
jgi:gamma-glutamyltranspeptidase/glutathione hydrolase